jgi:hypothetical protein
MTVQEFYLLYETRVPRDTPKPGCTLTDAEYDELAAMLD